MIYLGIMRNAIYRFQRYFTFYLRFKFLDYSIIEFDNEVSLITSIEIQYIDKLRLARNLLEMRKCRKRFTVIREKNSMWKKVNTFLQPHCYVGIYP